MLKLLSVPPLPFAASQHTSFILAQIQNSKFNMLVSCQEGRHRPALSLFAKVFCAFSCILPKVTCFQKFAFAKHSGAGSYFWQRKTGSSRWGTPCLTYRVWILAECVLFRGAPCFCFAFNLLTRDFPLHSSNTPPAHRSGSAQHTPAGHYR